MAKRQVRSNKEPKQPKKSHLSSPIPVVPGAIVPKTTTSSKPKRK